jgi:hypothetical protein
MAIYRAAVAQESRSVRTRYLCNVWGWLPSPDHGAGIDEVIWADQPRKSTRLPRYTESGILKEVTAAAGNEPRVWKFKPARRGEHLEADSNFYTCAHCYLCDRIGGDGR